MHGCIHSHQKSKVRSSYWFEINSFSLFFQHATANHCRTRSCNKEWKHIIHPLFHVFICVTSQSPYLPAQMDAFVCCCFSSHLWSRSFSRHLGHMLLIYHWFAKSLFIALHWILRRRWELYTDKMHANRQNTFTHDNTVSTFKKKIGFFCFLEVLEHSLWSECSYFPTPLTELTFVSHELLQEQARSTCVRVSLVQREQKVGQCLTGKLASNQVTEDRNN